MKTKKAIEPGGVFGRWTVIREGAAAGKEQRWLCRCTCGEEREVLDRALRYGLSLSCGCLTRERAGEKNAMNLLGKTFGDLTVIDRAPKAGKNGGARWLCRCSCGQTCVYLGTLLAGGKRMHCGCKTERTYAFADIAGQRFGRLTAVEATEKRDAGGGVIWRCACDCGETAYVSYNNLIYGGVKSCGCKKREHEMALNSYLTHVDGTSVDMLRSKKVPKNNTTGVKGVYLIKGKYVAKIVIQKKQYFLGSYDDLESAKCARLEAEELIRETVVSHYGRWKEAADENPAWAQLHPIQISVSKSDAGRLNISLLPSVDEIEKSMPVRMTG